MNGIDKIIDRIGGDAKGEIDGILAQANEQAQAITAKYAAQASAEAEEILSKGRKAAAERGGRLDSVAQLECRKENLAVKQEVIEEACARAPRTGRTPRTPALPSRPSPRRPSGRTS